jgi:hypothetical protein
MNDVALENKRGLFPWQAWHRSRFAQNPRKLKR